MLAVVGVDWVASERAPARRDPAQGPPKSAMKFRLWASGRMALQGEGNRSLKMKALSGWALSVGLLLAATAANAQGTAPLDGSRPLYRPASDFSRPYADQPPGVVAPPYGTAAAYPMLLPPHEVYSVLRESGFSPLGVPRLRGIFYHIAAIDRRGEDGRLVIDARNGQIVRFMPAFRFGDNFDERAMRPEGPVPPLSHLNGPPRPQGALPNMASRATPAVPVPKAAPPRPADEKPLAEKPVPAPVQKSAAVQVKPADTPPAVTPAPDAKPAEPAIAPTQPMPSVQGLE
jgi:hypothetical protein